MKTIALIAMFLLTMGCAKDYCDPELCSYVEQFKFEAADRNVPVYPFSIAFVEHLEGQAGVCNRAFYSCEILIDKGKWESKSSEEREFLILHESAHCGLLRTHTDTLFDNGMPTSIMHAGNNLYVTEMTAWFNHNREYYMDELFTKEQEQ